MTHRAKSRALYAAGAGIMALLAGGLVLISRNQAALNASQEIRYNSHLLATELRHSSEDLTRLARTYVVTGDSRYEEMYWDVLAVRNGEKPRPDGRRIALRKLMEEAGFTADEFAKLTDAENKSNGLVRTETIAMNAVKRPFRRRRRGLHQNRSSGWSTRPETDAR